VAQQQLDCAQVGSGFEQMSGKAVPQSVRMKLFLDAGSVCGLLAGLPDHIGVDRLIPSVPAVAGKQPYAGLATQTAPVLAQRLQQLRAEHYIAVFSALSTLNVDDHALTVDVADLQVRELGSSHSGGIERHQQNAVERAESRIDEAGDLLLTQDGRQTDGSLGIRSLRHAPWLFERLDEEEADGCHMLRHGVGGQFSRAEQVRLVLADVLRA